MIPTEKIEKLTFKKLIMTIGNLPSSYVESLSHYECVLWLCNYLEKTVIPAVNNNGEAVEELQNLFIELKSYVDNYLSDEHLQPMINEKLDEMASDGTLADIVAQYVQLQGLLTYNSVAEMKVAENIALGSFLQTYGYYSSGDKGACKYKARTITNSDVIDDMSIIALSDPTLVAEIVIENSLSTKQVGIIGDGTTEESTKLQKFFNIPADTYIINSANILIDGDINIPSNCIINFEENSKITRKATSESSYFMFNIINKHDIVINNAHMVGDRETHTGSSGEWGYGFNICYSQNITLNNCIVEYTWGDGFYIGHSFNEVSVLDTKNITLNECRSYKCSRNGFSVCGGESILLNNCVSEYIDRIAPKAGLDIEPEQPENVTGGISDLRIINFVSKHNDYGIQIHVTQGYARNININNHHSDYDKYGLATQLLNYKSTVKYTNCLITRFATYGVYLLGCLEDSTILLQNINIDSTTSSSETKALYFEGTASGTSNYITVDGLNVTGTLDKLPTFAINNYYYNFNNTILRNITHTAYPDGTLNRIYLDKPTGFKIENCTFYDNRSTTNLYYGKNIANNINIVDAVTGEISRHFQSNLADGIYILNVRNNANTQLISAHFQDVVVYDGDTIALNGSGSKYYKTTKYSSYLKFAKTGSVFAILENVGFDET